MKRLATLSACAVLGSPALALAAEHNASYRGIGMLYFFIIAVLLIYGVYDSFGKTRPRRRPARDHQRSQSRQPDLYNLANQLLEEHIVDQAQRRLAQAAVALLRQAEHQLMKGEQVDVDDRAPVFGEDASNPGE